MRQAVAQWLEVAELEHRTRERYDDLIRLYVLPTLGDLQAAKLDAESRLSVVRRAITADYLTHHGRGGALAGNRTRLVHTSCHRNMQLRKRKNPTLPSPATPTGLA